MDAQVLVGSMYLEGDGIPKNREKAFSYLQKGAQAGHVSAMRGLGEMYRDGNGVAQDGAKALDWLRQADEKGEPVAPVLIGELYVWGRIIPKDLSQARAFFKKGAENGIPKGQFFYGLMCARGDGGVADREAALKWIQMAVQQRYPKASEILSLLEGDEFPLVINPFR